MSLYRILHKVVRRLSQHNLIISKYRKGSAKENNGFNKTCRYVHDFSMYVQDSVCVQRFMSSLHKIKSEY
jgi:hypothetical protein